MGAARRHLILNDTISSKVFSKSLHIYISKGEKLLSFHSVTPSSLHPPPPRGDFYFYKKKKVGEIYFFSKKKSVFFQSLSWSGLSQWCHISICFLGPSAEMSSGNISGTNWCLWRQWAPRFSERLDVTFYPGTEFHTVSHFQAQFNEIYSKIQFYS